MKGSSLGLFGVVGSHDPAFEFGSPGESEGVFEVRDSRPTPLAVTAYEDAGFPEKQADSTLTSTTSST